MAYQSSIPSLHTFELSNGTVSPLGTSLCEHGCNFSVYAPDAEQVFICLFDENEQALAQILLNQRLQSKWYGFIHNVSSAHLYGIRIKPKAHRKTHPDSSFNKLLIDPYARSLNRPLNWSASEYEGDSTDMVPKARILPPASANLMPFAIDPRQRVIYEAHVKGLTQLHPQVPDEQKGKYLGACHPMIIKHLQALGVTSVQFLPLMSFMPEAFIARKGLTNYWGYNPVNFFAAEPRYANKDALSECKQMIQTYRNAGIEVILDVVFNHTCEGGEDGPVLSFKGLCESNAYLIEQNDESEHPQYLNFSGCGNTLKVSNTYISTLLVDALRYWVTEMGVSGFRFDLASILGREVIEFKNTATFFKILRQDPILKQALMLAEPWDIGPGGYQLGQYPDYWLEVNDKFRDTVRGFWRGDKGLKGDFATRFMGSRDVFRKNIRPMHASVNNITYHDGFTLHDLVSYEHKHNLANLEDNRDGHNHNLSANYGCEGQTEQASIIAIREQQKRNMFATLILSQGTPHILGGDELSRTQNGNNNAYCQDNEINWLDWNLSTQQQQFLTFCRYAVQLRQGHSLLQQMNFSDDLYDNCQNVQIADWYRRDGSHKTDIDWVNHEHHCFALHIVGEGTACDVLEIEKMSAEHSPQVDVHSPELAPMHQQEWLFCVNSLHEPREFNLPMLLNNDIWTCVLDTAVVNVSEYQNISVAPLFDMPARSLLVFKKR